MRNLDWLYLPWAKTTHEEDHGFPLIWHLLDVSDVIVPVAYRFVGQEYLEELSDRLDIDAEKVLRLVGALHDVGKMSYFFQQKIPVLYGPLEAAGFPPYDAGGFTAAETHHSAISGHAINKWLDSRAGGRRRKISNREAWFYILAGHHGSYAAQLREPSVLTLEPQLWHQARQDLIEWLVEYIGFTSSEIKALWQGEWKVEDVVIVTGLLIIADWLGSNEEYFPYEIVDAQDRTGRLDRALNRIDLGGVWQPDPDPVARFWLRFNVPEDAHLRPVQQAVIDAAHAMESPSLLILENETGGGKTAAALMAADILADKFGLGGLYFAQPTMVNSNAMFSQVLRWLESNTLQNEFPVNTILTHGKAAFNEEYGKLRSASFRGIFGENENEGKVEAAAWFSGTKKGLLGSVVVGTIDQLLFAALQSKHVVLRHVGLFDKVVIIDEVHASDTYMMEYLVRLLEWLGYYGVPVIALSATVSRDMRTQLLNAYRRGTSEAEAGLSLAELEEVNATGAYPRLSITDSSRAYLAPAEADGRSSTFAVEYCAGEVTDVAQSIAREAENGGCVAAICSTVSRAQELYSELTQLYAREETSRGQAAPTVILLHSRFIGLHRAAREQHIVNLLGRDPSRRPKRFIVVSTQIIEQGLDLDFDLMFSDIAPIDLLVQRAGRLHRHPLPLEVRPENMRRARLVLMGVEQTGDESAPVFSRGIEAVYRRYRLLRTELALQRHLPKHENRVTTPEDIASLIATVYDDPDDLLGIPAGWRETWNKAQEQERAFHDSQRERACVCRLPSPEEDSVSCWSAAMTTAQENGVADAVQVAAQVRDIDESIEVVIVRRVAGRVVPLVQAGKDYATIPVDGDVELDYEIAKRLAQCTVRLPGYLVADNDLKAMESESKFGAWENSSWLKGMLPLILDEDLSRALERVIVHYDEEKGLTMIDPLKE